MLQEYKRVELNRILSCKLQLVSYLLFPGAYPQDPQNVDTNAMLLNFATQMIFGMTYYGIIPAFLQGTVGKRLLGLKMVSADLKPVGIGRSLGRYFATIISTLPFGLGFFWAAFSAQKRTWHDMIAKTLIVKSKELNKEIGRAHV